MASYCIVERKPLVPDGTIACRWLRPNVPNNDVALRTVGHGDDAAWSSARVFVIVDTQTRVPKAVLDFGDSAREVHVLEQKHYLEEQVKYTLHPSKDPKHRINGKAYIFHPIPGDGNCFFHAYTMGYFYHHTFMAGKQEPLIPVAWTASPIAKIATYLGMQPTELEQKLNDFMISMGLFADTGWDEGTRIFFVDNVKALFRFIIYNIELLVDSFARLKTNSISVVEVMDSTLGILHAWNALWRFTCVMALVDSLPDYLRLAALGEKNSKKTISSEEFIELNNLGEQVIPSQLDLMVSKNKNGEISIIDICMLTRYVNGGEVIQLLNTLFPKALIHTESETVQTIRLDGNPDIVLLRRQGVHFDILLRPLG